jgi:hypothetical protein
VTDLVHRPVASPATAPASLVDLLDRVLAAGIVLSGDLTLCLAGVDLVTIRLRALITSVRGDEQL